MIFKALIDTQKYCLYNIDIFSVYQENIKILDVLEYALSSPKFKYATSPFKHLKAGIAITEEWSKMISIPTTKKAYVLNKKIGKSPRPCLFFYPHCPSTNSITDFFGIIQTLPLWKALMLPLRRSWYALLRPMRSISCNSSMVTISLYSLNILYIKTPPLMCFTDMFDWSGFFTAFRRF